jgi:Na+-transporting methylmalonyl-CoA/oxaloacetate decarboxylase gamma subunit
VSGSGGGVAGGLGALLFVIGLLVVFALLFASFLVVPFLVFIGGIIAMVISDRKRDPERVAEAKIQQEEAKLDEESA